MMLDQAPAARQGAGRTVVMFILAFLGAAAVSWLLLIGPPKTKTATASEPPAASAPAKPSPTR